MSIGYLGPPGTFAEEALLRLVSDGSGDLIPFPTVIDCVEAVRSGVVPEALVPIENSIEGSVNQTLDQLAAANGEVVIRAEVVQPVRHHLCVRTPDVTLDRVTRVLSHPHALPQCSAFLRANLPGVATEAANSTADAVRMVSQSNEPWAAIGPRRAAEIYGCHVLAEDIEDARDNATRFVLLGREPVAAVGAGEFVTSIICVPPRDRPGLLLAILQEFALRAVNLTQLQSRPEKSGLRRYLFFIDMEGSRDRDLAVAAAIGAIEDQGVARVISLGSYPAAATSG